LLSNNELNSGQIDNLLKLVKRDLPAQSDGTAPPLIALTDLAQVLLFTHQESDNPDFQKTHLQAMVKKCLVKKRALLVASMAWILLCGNGHWVLYMVNPASLLTPYGDSLGRLIPVPLLVALQWWLLQLCGIMELSVDDTVTIATLPITPQDDGFLCGILATNSIGHHLMCDTFPLIAWDRTSIKTYRIECTIKILMLDGEFVHAKLSTQGVE
jgi:hypothetical protein